MKRILHISKYYYPYAGGIEDVCYNIVNILKSKNEIEQQIFCFNDSNKTKNDVYEGIKVKRVAVRLSMYSQPISMCYKQELKKTIGEFKPDCIHFHAPNPLAMYYLLKVLSSDVRLIVHWHSDIVTQSFIYKAIKSIETKLLRRADLILATSPNYIHYSQPLLGFVDKVEVLANMIDPSKFALTPEREIEIEQIKKHYNNRPIVLFVGRHVPYKGLKYLIEAAQIIESDCVIIIGGKGPLTERLKKNNTSEKVHFIGRIEDDLLAAHYLAADVFAFPSITRNEAFGVALAEAMYCQTAAVTFTIRGSGVNWVSPNGHTGIEVENSNSQALAQTIDLLLRNEELRNEMAQKAKIRVEKMFLIKTVTEQIHNLYQ